MTARMIPPASTPLIWEADEDRSATAEGDSGVLGQEDEDYDTEEDEEREERVQLGEEAGGGSRWRAKTNVKPEIAITGVRGPRAGAVYQLRRRGFRVLVQLEDTTEDKKKKQHKQKQQQKKKSNDGSTGEEHKEDTPTTAAEEEAALKARQMSRTFMFGLRATPALLTKLAVIHNMPLKRSHNYTPDERVRLLTKAVEVLQRCEVVQFKECFLLHNHDVLDALPSRPDATEINAYFGSQCALYFSWVRFYTSYLSVPAAAGCVLFARQLYLDEVDSPYAPLFNILVMIWVTIFTSYWRRRQSELAFAWGVMGVEEKEERKDLVRNALLPPRSKMLRYAATGPITIVAMYFLVRNMLWWIWMQDNATSIYGEDSWLQYWPTIVYSTLPMVIAYVWDTVAVWLTDFEGHTVAAERQAALVLKTFAFQFVNSYAALFYIAFWLQDLDRLRSMLATLLISKQLLGNAIEVGWPLAKARVVSFYNSYRKKQLAKAAAAAAASAAEEENGAATTEGGDPNSSHAHVRALQQQRRRHHRPRRSVTSNETELNDLELPLVQELNCDPYDVSADYCELVIQFGFVTFFAVAFPIAPLLALLNNILEDRVDFFKLRHSRRPFIANRSSIGAWALVMEAMSLIGVLTNCAIISQMAGQMQHLVPEDLHFMLDTDGGRLALAVVLEHIILLLKFGLATLIDPQPASLRKEIAKEEASIDSRQLMERKTLYMSKESTIFRDEAEAQRATNDDHHGRDANTMGGDKRHHPNVASTAEAHDGVGLAGSLQRQMVAQKLQQMDAGSSGFSPFMFFVLSVLPYVISYFGIPIWVTIPLALVWLSYLRSIKERKDRAIAVGVVTDPNVLKLIRKEMPAWIIDSDSERVLFMNRILQRLWTPCSYATKDILLKTVQPLLDQYRPSYVTSLGFREISLGTIPPTVSSVRVHDTQEQLVRMDIEIKWAGNPEFTIEVGRKTLPLVLELTDIRFSAKVRVELNPLVPVFPLFGAIRATCLERPHVDFAFKVANLDVMSIGAADYTVASMVSSVIKQCLSGVALYPKYVDIPIIKDTDLKALKAPVPVGLLQLVVRGGRNLMVADLTTSDPYVEVIFGDEKRKTAICYRTLDPVWNAAFEFMVFDPTTHPVVFNVLDYDKLSTDDPLGSVELRVDALDPGVRRDFELELDAETGSLLLTAEYTPLTSPRKQRDEADADVIFSLLDEHALSDDVIATEVVHEPSTGTPGTTSATAAPSRLARIMNPLRRRSSGTERPSSGSSSARIGVVTVAELRCRDLVARSGALSLSAGKQRVYVTVSVGNRTFTTSDARHQAGEPVVFPETYNLVVHEPGASAILLEVFHKNRMRHDSRVGSASLRCNNIVSNNGDLVCELPLRDKAGNIAGQIHGHFFWNAPSGAATSSIAAAAKHGNLERMSTL